MAILNYYGIKYGEWIPAKECELEPRAMRKKVSDFNDMYGIDNEHNLYIVSGRHGYKLTRNLKEIRDQIEHDERLAKKELFVVLKRRRKLERFETIKAHKGELV